MKQYKNILIIICNFKDYDFSENYKVKDIDKCDGYNVKYLIINQAKYNAIIAKNFHYKKTIFNITRYIKFLVPLYIDITKFDYVIYHDANVKVNVQKIFREITINKPLVMFEHYHRKDTNAESNYLYKHGYISNREYGVNKSLNNNKLYWCGLIIYNSKAIQSEFIKKLLLFYELLIQSYTRDQVFFSSFFSDIEIDYINPGGSSYYSNDYYEIFHHKKNRPIAFRVMRKIRYIIRKFK